MADSKWKGVERLADAIQENWIGGGSAYTIAEAAEKVLRERLVPLLEAVKEGAEYIRNNDAYDEKLQKELATWR